jgi:undecaprenyl diphosphate synthase
MDGNGRWAESRGEPRIAGHKRGAEAVRRTAEAAANMGITYLTLFGFSSENWKRPKSEIGDLMSLLRLYLRSEIAELKKKGVKLRVIGDRSRLESDIVSLIDRAEAETVNNTRLTLVLALSYGSRAEIARAAQRLAKLAADGRIDPDSIDEQSLEGQLETSGIPDPDLLIRTSGEKRVSNFLLWQLAYTELVFMDVLWPEFGAGDLADAVREYHQRERRYGSSVSTA